MRVRRLVSLLALVLLFVAAASAAEPWVAPRGPGGKPDLNGTWQAFSRANDGLEAHAARAARALREGPHGPLPAKEVLALGAVGAVPAGLGVVVGGKIPYQDWARAKQQENRAAWLERDPEIKCYQPGIPRATYLPYPFQIFHNERALFFAYEYAGAVRNVLLENPGPAPLDSWMGQSVGTWDGDTLVIETTGQNDQTWLDRAGNFHSEALRVVERFTPTSPHTLDYEATLEDEKVFTRPWKIRMTLYRLVGDDAVLQKFNCVEFVEELVYGHLRKKPLDRELPE
ncbi:MAG: hypothetical protein ABFS41_11375 [Myxococcota bacterium]